MTDNEIIKALDESEVFLRKRVKDGQPIKLNERDVEILRNISQVCAKTYDKIDRQQTDNESLKVENQSLRGAANSLKMHYEEAQAEIERLENALLALMNYLNIIGCDKSDVSFIKIATDLNKQIRANIKAKAVKEFVEKLKEKASKMEMACCGAIIRRDYTIDEETLDNLVKEMVGEDNA